MKTQEEIEELADKYSALGQGAGLTYREAKLENIAYRRGYEQCQEDMADKKYTEEDDIKEMALDYIINTGGLPKTIEEWQNALWKFYQSLNKQD